LSSRRLDGTSSIRFGGSTSPSSQYGAPSASRRLDGTSSLSTQYDASSRFGGASSLSSQLGATRSSSRSGVANSLSTHYGAPSASSRLTAPASQYAPGGGYAPSRGRYNAQEDDLAVSTLNYALFSLLVTVMTSLFIVDVHYPNCGRSSQNILRLFKY
jgi:hypothetical protein